MEKNVLGRLILKLGLTLGLFIALGLTAFAAAPVGTMAMTSQSVATATSAAALNTITITDQATAEITAANDIFIRIPSTINARFDTTDTTVTIVQSATGVTSTTVSFPVNNKTMKLNVTTNFANSENVQIGGISILADAVTASTPLVWAIDNTTEGSATFSSTSSASLAVTATNAAGALTMSAATVGSNGTATLTLDIAVAMAINDTVTFTAPAELDVSNLSTTAVTGSLDGTTGVMSCTAVAQVVTCTLTTVGDHAAGAGKTIIFPASSVRGAYVAAIGNIADLAVNDVSATPAGADINSDTTVATPEITVGDLTSPNVTPESLSLSTISPTTFTFVTTAAIPASAKIVIVYPAGWNLAGAAGQIASGLSGLSGTWTATVSGQTLTLTGGTSTGVGTKTFTLNGIMTPPNEGSGGTYSITTRTTADVNIETAAAVSADTIIGKVSSSIVVGAVTAVAVTDNTGGGVLITWVDPTGSSDATKDIKIMKGTAPLPVDGGQYALVLKGVQKYVDTNVKTGDVVTYQLRASNGSGETGATTAPVSFTVGSTVKAATSPATATTPDATTTPDADAATVKTDTEVDADVDADADTDDDSDVDSEDDAEDTEEEDDDSDMEEDDDADDTEEVKLSDIASSWAKAEITNMVELGIIKGHPDGSFKPKDKLKRSESAILLCRILSFDEEEEVDADPFTDVKKAVWYGSCVAQLKEAKIVNGNPDKTYKPENDINRAEFVALAMRAYGTFLEDEEKTEFDAAMNNKEPKASFTDVDVKKDWFANVATVAKDNEFVMGRACGKDNKDKCFDGATSITREEAAAVLDRIFGDLL